MWVEILAYEQNANFYICLGILTHADESDGPALANIDANGRVIRRLIDITGHHGSNAARPTSRRVLRNSMAH